MFKIARHVNNVMRKALVFCKIFSKCKTHYQKCKYILPTSNGRHVLTDLMCNV